MLKGYFSWQRWKFFRTLYQNWTEIVVKARSLMAHESRRNLFSFEEYHFLGCARTSSLAAKELRCSQVLEKPPDSVEEMKKSLLDHFPSLGSASDLSVKYYILVLTKVLIFWRGGRGGEGWAELNAFGVGLLVRYWHVTDRNIGHQYYWHVTNTNIVHQYSVCSMQVIKW